MEAQGIFVNILGFYWNKNCSMSLANAKQRFSKHIAGFNQLLESAIIKVDKNDNIIINFLDEQMNEFIDVSEKRAIAGKLGGLAKAKQMPKFAKAKRSNIDKEIDKDKEEDKEIGCDFLKVESFVILWNDYLDMRKKIRKPATKKAQQLSLNKLAVLSNNNIGTAILLIEQSIMNSWQGIFPLKENFKTKNKLNSYGERYPEYFHADGTPREL